MSLPAASSRVLIQGITGREGARMARWMAASGSLVVAGVVPGKGGQEADGWPVFDAVRDAPTADVACVVVPPAHASSAVQEALSAGIRFVHVLTEDVPLHEAVEIRRRAKAAGACVLGPGSVGWLRMPDVRIGYIGGERPFSGALKEGDIAILSTSGGMANELMAAVSRAGEGIRLAIATGGGRVVGTDLREAVAIAEADPEVRRLVVFAEPGQPILRQWETGPLPSKPLVLFFPGAALDALPRGLPYGHTGAVLGEDEPSVVECRARLARRGIVLATSVPELVERVKGLP